MFQHKLVKEKVELQLNCYVYLYFLRWWGVVHFTGMMLFLFLFCQSTSLWGVYSETFIHRYNVPLAHSLTRLCMIYFLHMCIPHSASSPWYTVFLFRLFTIKHFGARADFQISRTMERRRLFVHTYTHFRY